MPAHQQNSDNPNQNRCTSVQLTYKTLQNTLKIFSETPESHTLERKKLKYHAEAHVSALKKLIIKKYERIPEITTNLEGIEFLEALYQTLPENLSIFATQDFFTKCRNFKYHEDHTIEQVVLTYLNLQTIPILPDTTRQLIIFSNRIKELTNLPHSLEKIGASRNFISKISTLPNSLNYCSLGHNNLEILPQLPPKLKFLSCNNNRLTALPPLPHNLEKLECQNNNFSETEKQRIIQECKEKNIVLTI